MTVTKSTWTDKAGQSLDVFYNVGPEDVYLDGEWVTGTDGPEGWKLPNGDSVTIPSLISQGAQPQGPTGSIVVSTPQTVRVSGHETTVTTAEYVGGYNAYGALFANSTPTGAVLWVEPSGQLRPASES